MLNSYLTFYRWGFLVVTVAVLGCRSGNEITCPAVLEACPPTLPTPGTPCTVRGSAALCEYGNDPWYGCNTVAYCDSQGGWYTVASSEPDCPTTLPSGCAGLVRRSHVRRPELRLGALRAAHLPLPGGDLLVRVAGQPQLHPARGGGLSRHATARRERLLRPLHDLGRGDLRRGEHEVRVRDLAANRVHRVKRASYLGSYRGLLVAVVGAVGCSGGLGGPNQVSCRAVTLSCPATVPTDGAPCPAAAQGGSCEYGDDPFFGCDTVATCYAGTWSVLAPFQPTCPTTLPAGCPSSFADAQATNGEVACASLPPGLTCDYPEGRCWCVEGLTVLTCTPLAPVGCPAARPLAGTPCSSAPGACTSWGTGSCDGRSMTCACGVWQTVYCSD